MSSQWGKPAPECPNCGLKMVERKRRSDGSEFWGCSDFPDCKETRRMPGRQDPDWNPPGSKPPPPPKPIVLSTGTVALPIELVRSAILLTHPDRHPDERAAEANRVTAALNAAVTAAKSKALFGMAS